MILIVKARRQDWKQIEIESYHGKFEVQGESFGEGARVCISRVIRFQEIDQEKNIQYGEFSYLY